MPHEVRDRAGEVVRVAGLREEAVLAIPNEARDAADAGAHDGPSARVRLREHHAEALGRRDRRKCDHARRPVLVDELRFVDAAGDVDAELAISFREVALAHDTQASARDSTDGIREDLEPLPAVSARGGPHEEDAPLDGLRGAGREALEIHPGGRERRVEPTEGALGDEARHRDARVRA